MLSIQLYYIHPHSSVHIFSETLRSDIHQGATRRPVTCRPGRHMASVLGRSSWPGEGRGGHGFFHGWIQKNIWRKPSDHHCYSMFFPCCVLPGFPMKYIWYIWNIWTMGGFPARFPFNQFIFFFIRNRKFKRMISHVFSGSRIFEPTPTPMFWKKNLVKIDPKQTPCICRSPRVCVNLFLAAKDSRSFESVKVLGIICPSTEESHSPTVIETYWTNKWCDCMRVSWSR